jgi:hypothetical protein
MGILEPYYLPGSDVRQCHVSCSGHHVHSSPGHLVVSTAPAFLQIGRPTLTATLAFY